MGLENRIVYTVVDVVEGTCRKEQAMVRDRTYENLYIIPAAQTREKEAVHPDQMKALSEELALDFDFVFIDCPAGIEWGFRSAIAGAQTAIVVTTPEVSAIRDVDRVIGLLEAASLVDIRLIINRMNDRMVKRGDMMSTQDIVSLLSVPLLGVVPDSEEVVISTNRGKPLVLENRSRAGAAMTQIANVLADGQKKTERVPTGSLFGKMKRLLAT